jgi:hypothetical protein
MPTNNPITTPAGYPPAFAIGFSDQSGGLAFVDNELVHDTDTTPPGDIAAHL